MAHTYKNSKVDLTATSVTTVYTVPTATTSIVKSILVSDDSGSGDTITLTITNGSDVFSLFKTKTISANGTLELLSAPIVLTAGEILKATAATADRLHIICSYLEIT
jgi:hypothetical protein